MALTGRVHVNPEDLRDGNGTLRRALELWICRHGPIQYNQWQSLYFALLRNGRTDEEAPEGPANPNRGTREFRLISKRPSARRSPGKNPGPQGAFEVSMINVSCNSHYFSQLAAFFIDARAE